jgi:hypothetical protein
MVQIWRKLGDYILNISLLIPQIKFWLKYNFVLNIILDNDIFIFNRMITWLFLICIIEKKYYVESCANIVTYNE